MTIDSLCRARDWFAAGVFALACMSCNPTSGSAGSKGVSTDSIRIIFVGDILLDEGPGRVIAEGGDPFGDTSAVLAGADLAVGNLECPIALGGQAIDKSYAFRAHPATARVLASHLGAVSLANNHSGDYGPSALLETIHHLGAAKVSFFGAGRDLAEAHRPLIIGRRGLRVGLIGYNEFLPRRFEAGPTAPGVAWSEDEQVIADIKSARALGANVVIPFLHWGWENETAPCTRQRELAHALIDAGADAVIGSHPHSTQGVEIYRGKPIVYSLGNFIFDLFDQEANRLGWMVRLELDGRGVVRWETVSVRIDQDGTPRVDRSQKSPCGKRDSSTVHSRPFTAVSAY
jgi:poly-gamma-glutamate capsule biosynthesis protein CapA/YwtB (metallophosphatase superfamily)